ncbi:hypothetical protein [Psychroserpens luteolus]|uniref:hypothetical protein n=1 Tax=Psychroserpens luteolus TaxID=2855840 RepID=UPI001E46E766|nr:hypothetical protein [Psychroserpens luteolus]MCD2258802.1 hypothetical protein [Psychroserpens luteolus]
MKKIVLIIGLLLYSFSINAQEEQEKGVFVSDTTWLKEIIKFPLGFAPEIKYEGYEDLRFAKSWRDKDHPDFWCYTFVWHIKGIQKFTAKDLEQQMGFYYDGLMKAVNKKKDFEVPKTTALIINTKGNGYDKADFVGKLNVYDAFNTQKMITLNLLAKVHNCEENNTSNISFRLSPQDFEGNIWEKFKDIELRDDVCED